MPDLAVQVRHSWSLERLESDLAIAENQGIRIIANTITLHAWRSGPVEAVHAGGNDGYRLDERRVLPQSARAGWRSRMDRAGA